jgi:hypothetical protein
MNKVINREIVFSQNGIEIICNTHKSGLLTYTGTNNNPNALRTYMQASNLDTVKDYICV